MCIKMLKCETTLIGNVTSAVETSGFFSLHFPGVIVCVVAESAMRA